MRNYTEEQVDALLDEIESRIDAKVIDDLIDYDNFDDDDVSLENVLYAECCHKHLKEIRRDRDFIIKRRLGT